MSSVIYFKLSHSREKKTETAVTVEPGLNCHIRTHSGDSDDAEEKTKITQLIRQTANECDLWTVRHFD